MIWRDVVKNRTMMDQPEETVNNANIALTALSVEIETANRQTKKCQTSKGLGRLGIDLETV